VACACLRVASAWRQVCRRQLQGRSEASAAAANAAASGSLLCKVWCVPTVLSVAGAIDGRACMRQRRAHAVGAGGARRVAGAGCRQQWQCPQGARACAAG
jgi:hypothetical protein